MLKAARNIKKFTEGVDKDTFLEDNLTKDAVVLQLEIAGKAAKSVSADIRSKAPEVDWEGLMGMGDRLISAYFDVDYDHVWDAAIKDVPVIERAIGRLINELNSGKQG
nr:HepT-like ribonuclease domain-containing protein [Methanosarcina sp. KYL-1]